MTIERAIEILDPDIREDFYIQLDGLKQIETAMRMGMEALKKQQPMKPKEFAFTKEIEICRVLHHENVVLYKCGHCDAVISCHSKYCSDCGQALDWGEKR